MTTAPYRGELALYRAAQRTSCKKNLCLMYTRLYYGIDAKYATAYSAWRNMRSDRRRTSWPPPRGYPVFLARAGSSPGSGHVGISIGGGYMRSTDWPSIGKVSNVHIMKLASAWGMEYLGWGTELNAALVWVRTVDASAVTYSAEHKPHKNPNVYAVERSLYHRGYLAVFRVNEWWNDQTSVAYKKWEARLGATQNGIPGLGGLRQLARLSPQFIVKP